MTQLHELLPKNGKKPLVTKKEQHRESYSPEYGAWVRMRDRCYDENNDSYERYGGRGIKVCDEWNKSFSAFLAHIGRRPSPKHSLDRINCDGHYEPGNVRWATVKEQCRNKTNNRKFFYEGKQRSMAEVAEMAQISTDALSGRLRKGMTLDQAINYVKKPQKSKPIIQMELSGAFIKHWGCAGAAARALGIQRSGIAGVCKGKLKSCGGFKWKYVL